MIEGGWKRMFQVASRHSGTSSGASAQPPIPDGDQLPQAPEMAAPDALKLSRVLSAK